MSTSQEVAQSRG